jgi:hypothetical protein
MECGQRQSFNPGNSQISVLRSCFPRIFLVSDLLHLLDRFAVQRFLNADVHHRSCRRSAVPMLFTGTKPDDIQLFDAAAC